MIDRKRLGVQLNLDEGRKEKPYTDTVGKITIGVGHNLTDKGLPQQIIDMLLEIDIDDAERDLVNNLPWYGMLDPIRQEVLVNMCFNMGWPVLAQFKNTLDLIKTGQYDKAADAMLASKWAKQVGARANRLASKMRNG